MIVANISARHKEEIFANYTYKDGTRKKRRGTEDKEEKSRRKNKKINREEEWCWKSGMNLDQVHTNVL
jgi:hypothetical protein